MDEADYLRKCLETALQDAAEAEAERNVLRGELAAMKAEALAWKDTCKRIMQICYGPRDSGDGAD